MGQGGDDATPREPDQPDEQRADVESTQVARGHPADSPPPAAQPHGHPWPTHAQPPHTLPPHPQAYPPPQAHPPPRPGPAAPQAHPPQPGPAAPQVRPPQPGPAPQAYRPQPGPAQPGRPTYPYPPAPGHPAPQGHPTAPHPPQAHPQQPHAYPPPPQPYPPQAHPQQAYPQQPYPPHGGTAPYPPQAYAQPHQPPYPPAPGHTYPQQAAQAHAPSPYTGAPTSAQPAAPPRPPGDRRLLLAIGVGIAIVLLFVGGTFGITELLSDGDPAPRETSGTAPTPSEEEPSQSAPPSTPPSSDQVDISARGTDPKPLTVDEVYPGTTIAFNGATYRIHGKDTVADCRTAADGALATALAARDCNQVVRATAADESGQYLITVGIANLPTQADADQIYQLMEDAAKNGYFKRLSGTGPAKDFAATRDSVIGSMARGHYVIFAIGARGGNSGASLADEQLKTALKDLRLYSNERLTRRTFG